MPCTSAFFENTVKPNPTPTIKVIEGGDTTLTFQFLDAAGNPIDLTDAEYGVDANDPNPADDPDYNETCPGSPAVWFTAKPTWNSSFIVWKVRGTFTVPTEGKVEVVFNGKDGVQHPGVYPSQLILTVPDGMADCNVKLLQNYFTEVKPVDLMAARQDQGAPTIAEIRLMLRDTAPEANTLLDELEFSDDEIAHSIMSPVEQFNETPPIPTQYTPYNFPFRFYWKKAIVAGLLRMAAHLYRRNQLNYNAGGVTVDETVKGQLYDQIADKLSQEWDNWVLNKKIEMNVASGFGSLGSSYTFRQLYSRVPINVGRTL